MKAVYDEAANLSDNQEDFVIAKVIHTQGSTPQKPGASLLVKSDGTTVGTLGGGCVEGDIWFAAKEALREKSGPSYKKYFLNEDIAARDGLVCGGTMYFYIEPVIGADPKRKTSKLISEAYAGIGNIAIATVVSSDRLEIGSQLLIETNGFTTGTLGDEKLNTEIVPTALSLMEMGKTFRFATQENDEIFIEGYTSPASVILVGGGHVNLQVANLAKTLGFRIMVTDDREEFSSHDRFSMAELVNTAPYGVGLDFFPVTPNTAIVIGTRGHNFDDLALFSAAKTTAGYVGLLGSTRKTIMIYESLLKQGIPEERLRQIHAPIGLDLGGRTPEEIALSIMAEIVAWRNSRNGAPMTMASSQINKIVSKIKKIKAEPQK
ncbi:MAG: hypothetical protein CL763_06450 [Chloroflexi bacterium]|nr:hypothetical protein [Chloroflexota bacterium]